MSDYSVTGYNPNNVYYDTLYTNQGTNIGVTNYVPQTTGTNNTNNISLQIPPDTFELSAEQRIRGKSEKEKSMPTWLKGILWVGGAAAIAYGCVVGHRAMTKPTLDKVAQNFSEIFRRDVTKEEAQKFINNYKELLNIEDTEEFIKKAFEQVKKDYGYEKLPIELKINKVKIYLGSGDAGWCSDRGELAINVLTDETGKIYSKNKRERNHVLKTIIHEFQHVKQDEIAYRTSRDNFAEAIFKRKTDQSLVINNIKNILSKQSKLEIEAKELNMSVEECKERYEKLLKNLEEGKLNIGLIKFDKNDQIVLDSVFKNYEKFAENSEEYNLGLKYIENTSNYIQAGIDRKSYESQLLESEAYNAEKSFDKIYNSFASIWRIPFFQ